MRIARHVALDEKLLTVLFYRTDIFGESVEEKIIDN